MHRFSLSYQTWRAVVVVLCVAAVVPALLDRWVCDDAFITLRYVEQALQGHGLVFNPGERVEGYTHFLWAVLLWTVAALGPDAVDVASVLPIPFHAASVAVLAFCGQVLLARRRTTSYVFPYAALLWVLHRDAYSFASGGLETAAYTLSLVLGFTLVAASTTPRGRLAAVAVYALAALLRPEGLLHLGLAWGFLAARHRSEARQTAALALALLAPLFVWRWAYYGSLLPNTFHAKSAASPYWSQGFAYVMLYVRYYGAFFLGAAIGLAVVGPHRNRSLLLLAAAHALGAVLTTLYVGGDFMFGRFLLPATPFLALWCQMVVGTIHRGRGVVAVILAAGVIAGGWWRQQTLHGINVAERGIVHERSQYPAELIAARQRQGALLEACFRDTDAVFVMQGAQASYAYYGKLPVVIDAYGLTDAHIARQPLAARGRPGHERRPTLDYLLHRKTNFLIHLPGARVQRSYAAIHFGDVLGEIVFYDGELMKQVATCEGIRFVDFPAYFDDYVRGAAELSSPELRRDAAAFETYYFAHNADAARRAELTRLLQERSSSP